MNIKEAKAEIVSIAKRCGYEGKLTDDAISECAAVYVSFLNAEGEPSPRTYHRGDNHKRSNLSEIQWLLVRTPSFRKWFGSSKVVDENGEPRIMYHGSSQDFDEFKPETIKVSKSRMTLWAGPGFYFTDKRKVADIYAKGGSVKEVFIRLENPLMVDETGNASDGTGRITRDQAADIMLKGDNSQWLDIGLASELARMDSEDGIAGPGKRGYKEMTREERVRKFVSRLKTDVVKLKCITSAYGAKSQRKMMKEICAVTGHDGVIHRVAPDVTEWVVYEPGAVKSATENGGEFSTKKANVQDEGIETETKGGCHMAAIVESLRKIACDCADSDDKGYRAVMDSLYEIGRRIGSGEDAIDPNGKWITVHPNGAKEGEGRPIHLDKGGNIDSEGHLSNALKSKKTSGAQTGKTETPEYKYFKNTEDAVKYIQEKGKSYINATMSQQQINELTASTAAGVMAQELFSHLDWSDRMKKRDEIKAEMMNIIDETGSQMKNGWVIDDEQKEAQKIKEQQAASTMTGAQKTYFESEGKKDYEAIESSIAKAKEYGKQLQSRFEVSDYEDADEHHYHAMMDLVTKLGGKVLYQDSPEYDEEEGEESYGYARGFTAVFPPDAAHELFTKITVKDGYHGEMFIPTVAK